jgi:hypothetical protein
MRRKHSWPLLCLLCLSCAPVAYPSRVPAWPLDGIRMAESSGRADAVGDDGISIGAYQINERFHAERARKFGEYDPRREEDARRIAKAILYENYRRLLPTVRRIDPDSWDTLRQDLAIAAYRQGVAGVRRTGPSGWYVDRVRGRR